MSENLLSKLLDHLVGAGEERRRDFDPEGFCRLMLMASSNVVGCLTGRSAGSAP
jgi:hypothetical protein